MWCATEKDSKPNPAAQPFTGYRYRHRWGRLYQALNLLVILIILLFGATALSGKTQKIRGVQIEIGEGNRVCMSFEGKIIRIIVNRSVNLPGETFENITRIGNTKISRNHSGMLTRIGHIGISRDRQGNIIKIGNADVRRDKDGSIVAVTSDPNVSPLFAIDPP